MGIKLQNLISTKILHINRLYYEIENPYNPILKKQIHRFIGQWFQVVALRYRKNKQKIRRTNNRILFEPDVTLLVSILNEILPKHD